MRKTAYYLSLFFVFSIPWEDAISVSWLGSLTRIVGILTAGLWLFTIVLEKKIRKPTWFHIILFIFIFWNLTSYFWSASPDRTEVKIKTYAQLVLLSLILWELYTTRKALRAALQAYILGGFLAVGSTVYNYLTGQGIDINTIRYSASGVNAVDLALILSLGIPIAWYLATSHKNTSQGSFIRLLNYFYIPASLFAIVLTGSRTALFVVIPVFIYIFATATQIRLLGRIVFFIILIAALFIIQDFLPQAIIARLATAPNSIAMGDFGGRVPLWKASIQTFIEHPILGIGSGSLSSPFELGAAAHNTYLSILAETGVVGFIIFITAIVIVVYHAFAQEKPLSMLWIGLLAAWAVGVFSLTWEYRKTTWLIFSLILISAQFNDSPSEIAGDHLTNQLNHDARERSGIKLSEEP